MTTSIKKPAETISPEEALIALQKDHEALIAKMAETKRDVLVDKLRKEIKLIFNRFLGELATFQNMYNPLREDSPSDTNEQKIAEILASYMSQRHADMAAAFARIGETVRKETEELLSLPSMNSSAGNDEWSQRPLSDLNFGIRARRAMARLNLTFVYELLEKSGDDLLELKNFGVTTLDEIREKLHSLNLKLRGD